MTDILIANIDNDNCAEIFVIKHVLETLLLRLQSDQELGGTIER